MNDNYPDWVLANPNDPSYPWNRHDPDPIEFDVQVSMTIYKSTKVEDDQYILEKGVDYEYDDDGAHGFAYEDYDTSECDFVDDFAKQHYHPLALLKEYQDLLIEEKKKLEEENSREPKRELRIKIAELRNKIDDMDGWEWDDLSVEKE